MTVFLAAAAILLAVALGISRSKVLLLRSKLHQSLHNNAEIGNFLTIFSKSISRQKSLREWMDNTARYVADIIGAEGVCIFVPDKDNLVPEGLWGKFPPLRRIEDLPQSKARTRKPVSDLDAVRMARIKIGDGIVGTVAKKRMAVLIDDPGDRRIMELDQWNPIKTLMAVPLIHEGELTGVICAVNNRRNPDKPFDGELLGRMVFTAGQVVLAQNILKVYVSLSEQQRINQELDFARNLQSSLLPKSFPVWGRFQIQAFSRSAKEVSGDFYDFVEIDSDRLLVVIGDACGKGIPACMTMAMTRSFIRAHVSEFTTLHEFLQTLNANLYRDMADGQYITLGICLLNKKENTVEYARAGHTELVVYIRSHTRSINPDGAGLGLLPPELAEFDTLCIQFTPEMEVMLFTDGINEAVNPAGEYFGVDRIKDVFMKSCLDHDMPRDSISRLMGAVDNFTENVNDQADDQTVVIIRHS